MIREFSAGGIVYNGKKEVLLVQHSGNKYWGFPKGKIEKGQTSKEAAVREVKEEGGVEAEIIEKVGQSKYIYTSKDKEKVFKVVTIYLMRYKSGQLEDHDFEVSDAGWFEFEKALDKLSFSQDKELLKKAFARL